MDSKQAKKRDRRSSAKREEDEDEVSQSNRAKRQRTSKEHEETRRKRRVVADSSDDEEEDDNMVPDGGDGDGSQDGHDDVEDDDMNGDDVEDDVVNGDDMNGDEEKTATPSTSTSKSTRTQNSRKARTSSSTSSKQEEGEEESKHANQTGTRSTPSRAVKQEKDYLDDAPPHSSMKRVHDENRQIIRDTLRDYNINDFHVAALVPHDVCNSLMYNALCESYYVVCIDHDDDSQPCVLIMGETGYMYITLRSTATLLVKDRTAFSANMEFMFEQARRAADATTPTPSQGDKSSSSAKPHNYGEDDEEEEDAFSDDDEEECMALATDKYKNEAPVPYQFSEDMKCVKKISGESMKILMNAVQKWNAKTETEQSPIVMVWTKSKLLILRALSDERVNNSIDCMQLSDHDQVLDVIPAPHTDFLFFPSSVVTGALSMNLHNVFVTIQSVSGVKAETPSNEERFIIVDVVASNEEQDGMSTQTSMVFAGDQANEITKKPRVVSVDDKVDAQFNLSSVRKLFPTGSKISFSPDDAIVQVSTWTNNKYWKVDMFLRIAAEMSNDNE